MAKIRSFTHQVAVGQGGLMLASIEVGSPRRRFAFGFDCGSINSEHFAEGLESVDEGRLDILFISHLDADHVNGIDKLTRKVAVDAVVLPCIDPLQATVIAAHGVHDGNLSGTLVDLLSGPTEWFAARGVKRVIHVMRDGGDGPNETTVPFGPPDGDGPRPDGESFKFFESPEGVGYRIRSNRWTSSTHRLRSGTIVESFVLDAMTELEVDISIRNDATFSQAAWLLLPYVHPFAEASVEAFRAAVRSELKVPKNTSLSTKRFNGMLLRALHDPGTRDLLKNCYAILSTDNNKPSLSLYSGPLPRGAQEWVSTGPVPYRSRYKVSSAYGWLSTGDANLRKAETRDPWLTRYGALLKDVVVFQLPHHGSFRSVHGQVLDSLSDALMMVCAESGRRHHPHPDLLNRLNVMGAESWQVSEQPGSGLTLAVESRG